jgi:hypothetical protein
MEEFPDGTFGVVLVIFLLFFAAVFVIVFGAFFFAVIMGLTRWSRNNKLPLVTTPASLVAKRTHVSGGSGDLSTTTSYFAAFEIQGSERLEFQIDGREFGILVEGDRGQLTYQGTRYKGFNRNIQDR